MVAPACSLVFRWNRRIGRDRERGSGVRGTSTIKHGTVLKLQRNWVDLLTLLMTLHCLIWVVFVYRSCTISSLFAKGQHWGGQGLPRWQGGILLRNNGGDSTLTAHIIGTVYRILRCAFSRGYWLKSTPRRDIIHLVRWAGHHGMICLCWHPQGMIQTE